MVVVDTTVWVDYLNGKSTPQTEWFDRELLRQLRRFEIVDTGAVELAVSAARNDRRLRRHGRTTRKTIDCLIATACIEQDHALLHRDRDFDPFEEVLGLRVIHP